MIFLSQTQRVRRFSSQRPSHRSALAKGYTGAELLNAPNIAIVPYIWSFPSMRSVKRKVMLPALDTVLISTEYCQIATAHRRSDATCSVWHYMRANIVKGWSVGSQLDAD